MSDISKQKTSIHAMEGSREADGLRYLRYPSSDESKYLPMIRRLISHDLSEPYSIYVYRYFLYQWGDLCFMVVNIFLVQCVTRIPAANLSLPSVQALNAAADTLIGVVVSKLEPHRGGPMRGYIAMLAVREEYRGLGIATKLVRMAIDAMIKQDAEEVSFITL